MQHSRDKQLAVIGRDMLFVKTPVFGEDIHNLVNREVNAATYDNFQERIYKFARKSQNADEEDILNFADLGHVAVHVDNLMWRDKKYITPLRLINPPFLLNTESDRYKHTYQIHSGD